MVINNLKLKKRIFELFPKLMDWLIPYIPQDRLDEYFLYNYVNVSNYIDWTTEAIKEYEVKVIRCGFVIYTSRYCYFLSFVRPNEIDSNGLIACDLGAIEDYGNNTVIDGTYDIESFNFIMKTIMNRIGVRKKEDLVKYLVSLDLIDFDDMERIRLANI